MEIYQAIVLLVITIIVASAVTMTVGRIASTSSESATAPTLTVKAEYGGKYGTDYIVNLRFVKIGSGAVQVVSVIANTSNGECLARVIVPGTISDDVVSGYALFECDPRGALIGVRYCYGDTCNTVWSGVIKG